MEQDKKVKTKAKPKSKPKPKPKKKKVSNNNTESRYSLADREKELYFEIKERLISKGYFIVEHMYGLMIISHVIKVKVPLIPPSHSFLETRDTEKNLIALSIVVWHEKQLYNSEIFPEGSLYEWCWKNGADIVKIGTKEDIYRKWG